MNVIRFLYFIPTIVAVVKSSADSDNLSLLARSLSESKYLSSVNQSLKGMFEAGAKRLLQLKSMNDNDDCCCVLAEEIFLASDGEPFDYFGQSCSISDDLVVIGADLADDGDGAAYLFHLDGTEIAKLTPGDDAEDIDFYGDFFGTSVSIDEKVVVGSGVGFVRVFSRNGTYERTLRCEDCSSFGNDVATLGNLIVMDGEQNSTNKLFIYSNDEGQLLKTLDQGSEIYDVAISEQFIASTAQDGKTMIYSNTSPDFPKIAEINQGGKRVAVSNDRLVIVDFRPVYDNDWEDTDGVAYLYKTDGTYVTALDKQDCLIDSPSDSYFGSSVAITDDKVFVSAPDFNDDQAYYGGGVFIYSAVTGEFIKKAISPYAQTFDTDSFGSSVCASESYYVVGAGKAAHSSYAGAAYLFNIPS